MVLDATDGNRVHAVVFCDARHAHNFGWRSSGTAFRRFFVLNTTWTWLLTYELRLCRPFGTRFINLILPGTAVPGYRLSRPFGTAWLQTRSMAVPGMSHDRDRVTIHGAAQAKSAINLFTELLASNQVEQGARGHTSDSIPQLSESRQ
jgi:hypothetical protein